MCSELLYAVKFVFGDLKLNLLDLLVHDAGFAESPDVKIFSG